MTFLCSYFLHTVAMQCVAVSLLLEAAEGAAVSHLHRMPTIDSYNMLAFIYSSIKIICHTQSTYRPDESHEPLGTVDHFPCL